jgi:hypothetical protein
MVTIFFNIEYYLFIRLIQKIDKYINILKTTLYSKNYDFFITKC